MRKNRYSALKTDVSEEININLTPLIDVVFVVLIMFIIIAPMLELDKIQLASSTLKENKEMVTVQEESPVSIQVHADNTIYLNKKLVQEKELLQLLKQLRLTHPRKTPQLFHDKKAQFGTYQTVKNAVEAAGFEQLDIVLQPG